MPNNNFITTSELFSCVACNILLVCSVDEIQPFPFRGRLVQERLLWPIPPHCRHFWILLCLPHSSIPTCPHPLLRTTTGSKIPSKSSPCCCCSSLSSTQCSLFHFDLSLLASLDRKCNILSYSSSSRYAATQNCLETSTKVAYLAINWESQ